MRRKTSRTHRRTRQSVLEVRVMSPRIAWHGFLKLLGGLTKLACLLAVLTGIGYGIWRGIQHTFYNNPDFRLQVIDLNTNPVIDEAGLIELAGIDLTVETSLFDVDVDETKRRLEALPALVEARVERHLPGTLVVRVSNRSPSSWVAVTGSDLSRVRHAGGLLVDLDGYCYPCPPMQLQEAQKLPIILLTANDQHPLEAGRTITHPQLERCVKLLNAAREADAQSPRWIQSIRQANDWSLRLVTRQGASATFGLSNHAVQIEKLQAALDHAAKKGYLIDTINLIPKFNVPITVRRENRPPRAIPVSGQPVRVTGPGLSSNAPRH